MLSSAGFNETWLIQTVQDGINGNKPEEVNHITCKPLSNEGQNLICDLWEIKIAFKTISGVDKIVSLIAKTTKNIASDKEEMEDISSNRTETIVYQKVLNQFEKVVIEFDDKREKLWPNFIGYLPYTVILMENLKERNFDILNHTEWMNFDHSLLAMRGLGRFHALSKVLLERGVIPEEFIDRYVVGRKSDLTEKFFQGGLSVLAKCMVAKKGGWRTVASSEELGRRIEKIIPSAIDRLDSIYMEHDRKFDVLNHGDMKSSNILFEHTEYSSKPIALKFIDFQLCHVNSFIWDLLYLLFTTTRPSVRREHLHQLIEAYYESYTDNMRTFKCDDEALSKENIFEEYNRTLLAGFLLITVMSPVNRATKENALDLEKLFTHPPEEVLKEVLFTNESYVKEMESDIKYFSEVGVI